jgi:hypothetical protein
MSKRVLVLCQRKTSISPIDKDEVDSVASYIDKYIALNTPVRAPVGTPKDIRVKVEYLTYHHGERRHEEKWGTETPSTYADHIFLLSRINQYSSDAIFIEKKILLEKFLEEHNNTYDVIILNTCPLSLLDYNIIYQLLNSTGILVVKFFGNPESSPSKDSDPSVARTIIKYIPPSLFIKLNGSPFGEYTYIKKQTQSEAQAQARGKKLKSAYTTAKRRRQRQRQRQRQIQRQKSKRVSDAQTIRIRRRRIKVN